VDRLCAVLISAPCDTVCTLCIVCTACRSVAYSGRHIWDICAGLLKPSARRSLRNRYLTASVHKRASESAAPILTPALLCSALLTRRFLYAYEHLLHLQLLLGNGKRDDAGTILPPLTPRDDSSREAQLDTTGELTPPPVVADVGDDGDGLQPEPEVRMHPIQAIHCCNHVCFML
jgi:hypothetical protein